MKKSVKGILIGGCALVGIGAAVLGSLYMYGLLEVIKNPAPREGQIKVACVGDSVTFGYGVKNQPENNYPFVMGRLLGDGFNVCNFGISGSTAQPDGDQPYVRTGAYKRSLDYGADILIFMLGSNDSKPENWKSAEIFRREYLALLDTYLQRETPPEVYLCTPPTAYRPEGKAEGLTTFDINVDIVEEIADIVRGIAAERDYTLIDINDATENHRELFKNDCVHPNNEGAEYIARTVYEYIK